MYHLNTYSEKPCRHKHRQHHT